MAAPLAYVDGEYVSESEATVPLTDPGFRWGYNVYDVLRTFDGEPFKLDAHVDRLFDSCRSVHIDMHLSKERVREIIRTVLDAKVQTLPSESDAMAYITVSGAWGVHDGFREEDPRVVVAAYEIPFAKNATKYLTGGHLVTTGVRQLSAESVSPRIKHQSRLHFVLADREAKRVDPDGEPLVLDREGYVAEMKHANVFAVTDGVIQTPPVTRVLPGISRDVVFELAEELGLPVEEADLQLHDLMLADELFYTNTTQFATPITKLDETPVGDGQPGPVTEQLLTALSDRVDRDIVAQFLHHLPPEKQPAKLQYGYES